MTGRQRGGRKKKFASMRRQAPATSCRDVIGRRCISLPDDIRSCILCVSCCLAGDPWRLVEDCRAAGTSTAAARRRERRPARRSRPGDADAVPPSPSLLVNVVAVVAVVAVVVAVDDVVVEVEVEVEVVERRPHFRPE
ncbi:hypothetical protein TEQG_04074 [Trichophyton equinum CBS 127.97]|uniref:Uncharacterized protein n=1 Tax=Trichophyton equinum (strain ATCC MYA-4606 / CBS 127.97) TaxID=559882 RepID=F2PT38_TRIEC|nr:hypothetical protein TEQG_04074 [Trichophyton equinum CBS 127.97]